MTRHFLNMPGLILNMTGLAIFSSSFWLILTTGWKGTQNELKFTGFVLNMTELVLKIQILVTIKIQEIGTDHLGLVTSIYGFLLWCALLI